MRTTHCSLYLPGHTVHYIQGRKLGEYQIEFPERCRQVKITDLGAGWFETEVGGETWLGWNHEPDRVTMFARDSVLGEVVYVPFSKALASVRRDEEGRRKGSFVLYPAWGTTDREFEGARFRKCVVSDGPY
ncbi:hypothetical protein [Corynebacterium glyciniphilum]|uniref:hypothetical protein n=1 Tax=Corynebacterium glyciniphilum TaxID=1404244 RepID=UPI002652C4A5|nr:hypothetical protein [Corynebacterium glyciniphilum]MDN5683716.1 hypothetical protein [Corynebacterium glyciniphilum]MDN6707334.1 hypothetical protein [Corynebacterium glyciniphilum]